VLHQPDIPRGIYKVELRFRAKDIISLYAIMAMSLLRNLISYQLFLKRVGDISEEAWDADGVYVML